MFTLSNVMQIFLRRGRDINFKIKMILPALMDLTDTLESFHKVLSLIYLLSFVVLKIKVKRHIWIK